MKYIVTLFIGLILVTLMGCDKAKSTRTVSDNAKSTRTVSDNASHETISFTSIKDIFLNIHIGSPSSALSSHFYQDSPNKYTKFLDGFSIVITTKHDVIQELEIRKDFDLSENSTHLDKWKSFRSTIFYSHYKDSINFKENSIELGWKTKTAYRKNPERYCYGNIDDLARIIGTVNNKNNKEVTVRMGYSSGGKSTCDNNAEARSFGFNSMEPHKGALYLMKY